MPRRLRHDEYTLGWVCALPVELAAAQEMLDEEHETPPLEVHDTNIYTCGLIGEHNVVIACLPKGQTGTSSAAAVATQMQSAFKSIRFGLMVGIGGGVPSEEEDVRLGDVVVSSPDRTDGGVIQYGFGKATPSGFERTGSLNAPPAILLNAVSVLQARHMRRKGALREHLHRIEVLPGFGRDEAGPDDLFQTVYDHPEGRTCEKCDTAYLVRRPIRAEEVVVYYGIIASGNQVMRSAAERDRVSSVLGGCVLCFEMEAAGLMNNWPCLIIRGICDYADSHKNKRWQPYAAGAAAAYAKELLLVIPSADIEKTSPAEDVMSNTIKRRPQSPSLVQDRRKRTKPDGYDNTETDSAEQRIVPITSHHRDQTVLSEEQKRCLLESLAFEQLDARQMTIKTAHARTCKWLLKHEQYLAWNDAAQLAQHHGFLWIKGKAGTGKSTLMKFATLNARRSMKDVTVLSFFFNARGEQIERSTTGAYRSLLLQLLRSFPSLQSVFDSLGLLKPSADQQWTIESLQMLLEQAIRGLGRSSIVCFIDALDECDEEQVRDMIQFFERIGDLALSEGVYLRVCFSSRHYPSITIRNGLHLVLEGQEGHKQDITNFIESELKIGKSKIARDIRIELQEKASGIFMWVVLVVGILNKDSDRGQTHKLRRRLQEIPGDLNKLFKDILIRDTQNKEELVLCIQWILFAKKPLSPSQLYHAIFAGVYPKEITQWDPEETTKDVVQRYILNSSKGLAEVTVSKEPTVQFIHESVRDFLLKEGGLGKIWPEYADNFLGHSHEQLKQCCLNHFNIDIFTLLQIAGVLPRASSPAAADLRRLVRQAYPFLGYAVHNVLYHAEMAEGTGISQVNFLGSFPRPRWVRLSNLLERHDIRRHTTGVSLLYILAELDMANLVRVLYPNGNCMAVENERYGCSLFAAAALNSTNVLRVLLVTFDTQQADESVGAPSSEQLRNLDLGRSDRGRSFSYTKSMGLLWNATALGHDKVLVFLIRSGQFDINSEVARGRTLLDMACRSKLELSVETLLDAGAVVSNYSGEDGTTTLYKAAYHGFVALVRRLLERGADVNARGGNYAYALQAAATNGHQETVALLLERGADIDAQGGFYGNALDAASAGGHQETVALLLARGANVNAQGGFDGNALCAASAGGHQETVALLLARGADVNAQGGLYGNALCAASTRGKTDLVQLLLDNGADIHAESGQYGSALQAASYWLQKDVVELLLANGADVNAKGGDYGNALQAALRSPFGEDREAVIDLLKRAGAYAESPVRGPPPAPLRADEGAL